MVTKVVPGTLIATADAAQAAPEAASRMGRAIQDAIRDRGEATVALSGGSSPVAAYGLLARQAIDWSKVHVFWVDERAVPPDNDRSNFFHAKKALLDPAGVPGTNVHRMPGEAADLAQAAAEYEQMLRDTVKEKASGIPRLDLAVMGIGDDGHTASLFPGDPTVHVTDKLVAAVSAAPEKSREARLTMTVPMLENARATLLIVLGKAKNAPLERIWLPTGSVDETPGRIVRSFRGSVTWVIDRAAGGAG